MSYKSFDGLWSSVERREGIDPDFWEYWFKDTKGKVYSSTLRRFGSFEDRTVMHMSICAQSGESLTSLDMDVQVRYMLQDMNLDINQLKEWEIVLTGGEPFLNYSEVRVILCVLVTYFPNAKITVPTEGPIVKHYANFLELARRHPTINLVFVPQKTQENMLSPEQISALGIVWLMHRDMGCPKEVSLAPSTSTSEMVSSTVPEK